MHTDKHLVYMTCSSVAEWGHRNPRDGGFDSHPGVNLTKGTNSKFLRLAKQKGTENTFYRGTPVSNGAL